MKKFYFTFGSDEGYPHKNGYIIIEATNFRMARGIFDAIYEPLSEGVHNYAFDYDQEDWDEIEDEYKGTCHRIIPIIDLKKEVE